MTYSWIHNYDLFLFDFDGLLVNTEHLHFTAYKMMCQERGFDLVWDFERFCKAAHFHAEGMKQAIYEEFPELHKQEPKWDILYVRKKKLYQDLLEEGKLELMPGVEALLIALDKANIRRCVVTHSIKEHVEIIKSNIGALSLVPVWFTREDYEKPKPAPDGYLKAITVLGKEKDRIIGFEDSSRGYISLQGTPAKAVLICPPWHPQLANFEGGIHFHSFEDIAADSRSL